MHRNVEIQNRPKLLLLFQFTYLISGNNSSFMQYDRALAKDFDIYYALPEKDGIYHLMSGHQREKTIIIPQNTSLWNRIRRFRALLHIVKDNGIDLIMHVFIFDAVSMIALKVLTGVKIILYFGAARLGWKHRVYSHFYDRIILKNQTILDASLGKARKLEAIPIKRSALSVFDSSLFFVQKAATDRKAPADSKRLVLGYMGRIDNGPKGLLTLIEALSYLSSHERKCILRLMGDVTARKPNEKAILVKRAEALGVLDKLEFIDASVSPGDKTSFFENIDIFCLASEEEGSPIVVFEAMSFLVPVVATKVGSLPYYFKDRKEILYVNRNSPMDLANRIVELSKDKILYETMVENMRTFIKKIHNMQLGSQLVNIFKSIQAH